MRVSSVFVVSVFGFGDVGVGVWWGSVIWWGSGVPFPQVGFSDLWCRVRVLAQT